MVRTTQPLPALCKHDIGGNQQPWHFLVVKDATQRARLGELYHEARWAKRHDVGIHGPDEIPAQNRCGYAAGVQSLCQIGPFEVKSTLIEHDAVADSAVSDSPGEMREAIVKAFVILAPGHQPSPALAEALQDHVKQLTAPYKYPLEIGLHKMGLRTALAGSRNGMIQEAVKTRRIFHD
ncbi:hypothetical protein NKDENANG_02928 [Candidatus Entotheonellaceae bacterium PAL068K]